MTTAPHRIQNLLPLSSSDATLATVGGKGTNLARLAQAHFPVPGGFLLTTDAYNNFVAQDDLRGWIADQIRTTATDAPDALETTSAAIRARFRKMPIPEAIAAAIRRAYADLGAPPVAVRSSATAEDLPDMSFAGQQDTYLNVLGEVALLDAVRNCWGSLWTARAIGYRSRNDIDHDLVSLAVVVQEMVQSDVSGVLFTANPLNGSRTQTVIDATLGLGEALVSGLVEPDHYVVETATAQILERHLGEKATVIRSVDGGGTQTEHHPHADQPALTDGQIHDLVILGRRVANFYNAPQDIEWAFADGVLYLLQARPVTSLFPIPENAPEDRLNVYFSFGAVQGMLDPMTPLGQDVIRGVFAGGSRLYGYQDATSETQGVLFVAADRLWARIDPLLRTQFSRTLLTKVFDVIEPGTGQALASVLADPRLPVQRPRPTAKTMRRILPPLTSALRFFVESLAQPEKSRRRFQTQLEETLDSVQKQMDQSPTLAGWIDVAESVLYEMVPWALPRLVPRVAVGVAMLNRWLALTTPIFRAEADGSLPNPLEISRGLPHNVTTEMDLSLWTVATVIRQDAATAQHVLESDPAELSTAYQTGTLPYVVQAAVAAFLDRYGARGLAEIDFGRPRWREHPVQVFQMVQNYLHIEDESQAPDVVFRRGAAAAEDAIERYASLAAQRSHRSEIERGSSGLGGSKQIATDKIRSNPLNPPNPRSILFAPGISRARLIRWTARRVRALAGLRESPKFFIIRVMGILRQALLAHGEKLVAQGVLDQPDDLVFLHLSELKQLAAGDRQDWRSLIAQRRADFDREKRRRQIPRLLLGDGRAFFDGLGKASADSDGNLLTGSPVSPGVVEGTVHVVFDPHGANLLPGEILVCPGTDPAWTPLFLAAAGLVMEVGGLMTHGSVVAREYGIPAVVGVDRATERLKTGQRVRVDGSTGRVEVLEDIVA